MLLHGLPSARPVNATSRRVSTTPAIDRFIAEARLATRYYQSQDAATADGFMRYGVELPTMGEHWVNAYRIGENTFAPGRPAVLIYATIDGAARLAGVAYTRLVSAGDPAPTVPAFGQWHEHRDTSATPVAQQAAETEQELGRNDAVPRLYVMHAWIWSSNPDGVFTANNLALPLARLGVAAPESASRDALRALAFAGDDAGHYKAALCTAARLPASEEEAADSVLDEYRARVAREAIAIRASARLTSEADLRLTAIWDALWTDLERALPNRTAELRALRRAL
jgi:hypothetical protein